jgi:hypothetical protein
MKFREFTISQLISFTDSEEFKSSKVLPITPQRARSQAVNPAARPDDVVLTVACDEQDRIVGYIGALPDNPVSTQVESMAWNSCWWVDPATGNEAAMQLFLRFLGHWDKNVLFSEMTPHTYRILSRMNFFHTRRRQGYRGYLRLAMAVFLPSRHDFFHRVKWLLKGLDGLFNLFWNARLKIWLGLHKAQNGLSWEFIDPADSRVAGLIQKNPDNYLNTRGQKEFNWILDHPWVVEGRDENISARYHFTSHAKIFKQHWVLISKNEQPVVFMVLNNRDGHLKIPYFFGEEQYLDAANEFIVPFMIRERIKFITTFHDKLAGYLFKSRIPVLFKKTVPRFTGISKKLLEYVGEDFNMQDGDGDVVFT